MAWQEWTLVACVVVVFLEALYVYLTSKEN